MRLRQFVPVAAAAMVSVVLIAGCSSGGQASSTATASSSSADAQISTTSTQASGDSSTLSASAAATQDDDFDRVVVGTWKLYSFEASKGDLKKVGPELMSVLRDYGLHETLTFFHDGTFRMDQGRGNVDTYKWRQVADNELELSDLLDESGTAEDYDEDSTVTATIASGRMTLSYEDVDNGKVKLIYSKQ